MNARNAMAEGGALPIATSNAQRIPKFAELPVRDCGIIEVRDYGCCIAQERESKVYEPFSFQGSAGKVKETMQAAVG